MRIQIEPIKYGLDDHITSVELQWGNKGLFDNIVNLIILQFNEGNNLVSEKKIEMTTEDYLSKGDTKEERVDAILEELNIKKIEYEPNS